MYLPPRQYKNFKTPATPPQQNKLRYKVCGDAVGNPVIAVLRNPIDSNEKYLLDNSMDYGKFRCAAITLVEFRDFKTFNKLDIRCAFSIYDPFFVYHLDKPIVTPAKFNAEKRQICTHGIHYCKTIADAKQFYQDTVGLCKTCKRLYFSMGACQICRNWNIND